MRASASSPAAHSLAKPAAPAPAASASAAKIVLTAALRRVRSVRCIHLRSFADGGAASQLCTIAPCARAHAWKSGTGSMMLGFPEWTVYALMVPALALTARQSFRV
jgi:hypothetical protein